MKVYSFFKKYVLVLLGVLAFASCSDDDNAGVMSSKVMLNQELVASNYSFIWNGVTSPRKDDVKAKFEAVEGDSTKMKMTISGIVPSSDDDIQLVVDVLPQADEIQYQGKVENSDYDMTVSGVYFPSRSSVGHYFKLKVVYNVVKEALLKQPFTFNFKKVCTAVKSGDARFMTIDGVEYAYSQLAESTLSGMSNLYAKTDSVAKLTFSNDGKLTIDMLSNNKGETVSSNLMTIKYWLTNQSHDMILEFTKAQAESFTAKFLNVGTPDVERLFTKYKSEDKYILRAAYDVDGKLAIMLNSPYNANAMDLYVRGKFVDVKDELLKKQTLAFLDILKEYPNVWGLYFVSE